MTPTAPGQPAPIAGANRPRWVVHECDGLLVFCLLLSLLPLVALRTWADWHATTTHQQAIERWEDEALTRAAGFARGYGFARQIERGMISLATHLEADARSSAGHHRQPDGGRASAPPFHHPSIRDLSQRPRHEPRPPAMAAGWRGGAIRRRIDRALPRFWRPEVTRIYLFTWPVGGPPAIVRAEGLAQEGGPQLERLFFGLCAGQPGDPPVSADLDRRIATVFGTQLSAEVLWRNRGGAPIRVRFQGTPALLAWTPLRRRGRAWGALVMVFPREVEATAALERVLSRQTADRQGRFMPLLMPIASLRSTLTPIVPPDLKANLYIQLALSAAATTTDHHRIASLSQAVVRGDLLLLRAPVDDALPYELWLAGPAPATRAPSAARAATGLWLAAWLSLLVARLWRGRPLPLTMRGRFAIFLLLTGGAAIAVFLAIGSATIATESARRIDDRIRSVETRLRRVDAIATTVQGVFHEACRETLWRRPAKARLLAAASTGDPGGLGPVFARFQRDRLPLEAILLFHLPSGRALTAWARPAEPATTAGRATAHPSTYSAAVLVFSLLAAYDPTLIDQIIASSATTAVLPSLLAWSRTERDADSIWDLASYRGRPVTMDPHETSTLRWFDLVTAHGRPEMAVMFLARSGPLLRRQALAALRALAADPTLELAMAWQDQDERGQFHPTRHRQGPVAASAADVRPRFRAGSRDRPDRDGRRTTAGSMTAILQATARLGTRLLRQHGESIELGLAGRRIPALTLAARFSLAPEQAWERVWRSRLHLVGWGLAVTLLLVARALTGHVLFPLDQIRAGLIQILAGTFSQRLGLGRRDELGEVADAFDHMATGLQERVELGRFVSGTLEASLQEGGQPDLTPRVVRTVVLASDIRGFTSLSEANPPAAIVHLLEAHLEAMSRVIADHGGLVDKFIGDAVVAVFLADDELAAATRALAAARQMMAAHAELCRQRTAAGLFGYAIGVGIAVGEALVGSFGAAGRAEFTVLGAPRDEAEHLEALSKEGRHTRIVLSPQVATLLAEVPIFVIGQGEGLEVMAE